MTLIAWLEAQQARLKLSDRQFARLLGLPEPSWSLYRKPGKGFGLRLIAAAARAFPDQRDEIAECVLVSSTLVTESRALDDERADSVEVA